MQASFREKKNIQTHQKAEELNLFSWTKVFRRRHHSIQAQECNEGLEKDSK